ncbi:MAG: hypothetical protein K0R57_5615 [Paenibacillaceae bacterium]|jgi:xylan 1,4-beta-xylosidase|nr:hypothetical protein [Paenibacillaceae bacterium]
MKQKQKMFRKAIVWCAAVALLVSGGVLPAPVPASAESGTVTIEADAAKAVRQIKHDLAGVSMGGGAYSFTKDNIRQAVQGIVPFARLEGVGGPDYGIYDPATEQYNYSKLFDEIDRMHADGVSLMANIFYMPYWLSADPQGTKGQPWAAIPSDYDRWEEYIYQIVYNVNIANGGQRRIDYWEIWNEPSGNHFFSYWHDGKFNELYNRTAKAIKRADPTAKVGGFADNPYYQDYREWAAYQLEHGTAPDFVSLHYYGDWLADGYMHPKRYEDFAAENARNMEEILGRKLPIIYSEWNLNAESGKAPNDTTASYMGQALYWMQNNENIEKAAFFRIENYGNGRAASLLDKYARRQTPARVLEMFQNLAPRQVAAVTDDPLVTSIVSTNDDASRITMLAARHDTGAFAHKPARLVIRNHGINGNYALKLYVEDLATRDNLGAMYPQQVLKRSVQAGEEIVIDLGELRNFSVVYADITALQPGEEPATGEPPVIIHPPNPLNTVLYSFDDMNQEGAAINGIHEGIDFGEGAWAFSSENGHLNKGAYLASPASTEAQIRLGAGNVLKQMLISGTPELANSTVTVSSYSHEDVTMTLTRFPKLLQTNWTGESKVITISFEQGQLGGIDQIYYEPLFDPQPGDNLIRDPGFETGTRGNWTLGTVISGSKARTGLSALQIKPSNWTFNKIEGLKPNTEYVYSGWLKNDALADKAYLGVKDFGGSETMRTLSGTTDYVRLAVSFKTGATATSANIYFGKNTGAGLTYGDDFELREIIPQPLSEEPQ